MMHDRMNFLAVTHWGFLLILFFSCLNCWRVFRFLSHGVTRLRRSWPPTPVAKPIESSFVWISVCRSIVFSRGAASRNKLGASWNRRRSYSLGKMSPRPIHPPSSPPRTAPRAARKQLRPAARARTARKQLRPAARARAARKQLRPAARNWRVTSEPLRPDALTQSGFFRAHAAEALLATRARDADHKMCFWSLLPGAIVSGRNCFRTQFVFIMFPVSKTVKPNVFSKMIAKDPTESLLPEGNAPGGNYVRAKLPTNERIMRENAMEIKGIATGSNDHRKQCPS